MVVFNTKYFFNAKVLNIIFDTKKDMSLAMMRLSEFYESKFDNIKGKYFTTEQFLETYTSSSGKFGFIEMWEGYNMPKNVIKDFESKFHDISPRESNVLNCFRDSTAEYLIVNLKDDGDTLDHELAHAEFYLNEHYRERAMSVIKNLPYCDYSIMKFDLLQNNYHDDVLDDEIQAYMITGTYSELKEMFPSLNDEKILELQQTFKAVRKE